MCVVENFQPLGFGNSQSPKKFTGNPKGTKITTKHPMGRIPRRQHVGEDVMTVELAEKRVYEGSSFFLIWSKAVRNEAYAVLHY